jgi:ubiquinone biosynthesis protein
MSWIAPIMIGRIKVSSLANPPALVEVFAETIVEELDFRMEASNMIDVAEMLHDLKQDSYLVPRPHSKLVTRRVLVMERLQGFRFDDVDGMRAAEIDTELVIRAGLISFMEGALIQGIFHGDLHGGNLFVLEDGRTALLDFGIVGRLVDKRRLAFMRFMLSASTNDLNGQVTALRDLGAFPADTDIDAVIKDLGIDQPVVDPTTLNSEELVEQGQRIIKALLAYGAKLPKELMLYVKNLVFFDGAIARLAPDLDIIGELTNISMIFLQKHGERLSNDLGVDAQALEIDMGSFKAGLGVDESTESMTYRELQERRDLIQKRMRGVSPL